MASAGDKIMGGTRYYGSIHGSKANMQQNEYYLCYGSAIAVVIGSTTWETYIAINQIRSGGTFWFRVFDYADKTGGTFYLYKGTNSSYHPMFCIFKSASSLGNPDVTWYSYGYGYDNYQIRSYLPGSYGPYSSHPAATDCSCGYPTYYQGQEITAAKAKCLTV